MKLIQAVSMILAASAVGALGAPAWAQEETTEDKVPPEVSIRRLSSDSTVSGTLSIEVVALDATAVTTVSARAGALDLGIQTGTPAIFRLDTTQLANGKLELLATAADTAGNVGKRTIKVRVDNGPPPHPQGPAVTLSLATGTEVKGVVSLEATIAQTSTVRSVKAFAGKKAIGTATKPPYSFKLDTTWMEPQDLTFRVQAFDAEGRMGRALATVRVNNPDTLPPTVELKKPKAGETLSGVVWVEGLAKDDRGLKEVQLLADGKPVASRESGRFGAAWDTNPLTPGKHELSLKAIDVGGNETVTPVTSVEVVPFPAGVQIVGPAEGGAVDRSRKFLEVEWSAEKGSDFERVDMLIDGEVVAGRAHTNPAAKGTMVVKMAEVPTGTFEVSVRARKRLQRFVESLKRRLGGGDGAGVAPPAASPSPAAPSPSAGAN